MPRQQYRIARKVATIPVAAGGFATVDLPRDYDYETVFLRVAGGLQVTTAATAVRAEAPCQIVQRAELIADGKNNLHSAPFWFSSLGNRERYLTASGARATTPPTGTAFATYQVEANAALDFMTADGVRPKDSNFRSIGLSLFQLRLTFGNAADCFVGGVVAFNNMFVEVFVQQMVELPDAAGNITEPQALKKISYQEVALVSSNVAQEIRLPAGNNIKSVLIRTEGSITAGEPATNVLNNVQLVAGIDVRMHLSGQQLRAKNNADFGAFTAGYYVADVTAKAGAPINLSDLWDVSAASEPKVIMDVTGGATVKAQIVTTEYVVVGSPS